MFRIGLRGRVKADRQPLALGGSGLVEGLAGNAGPSGVSYRAWCLVLSWPFRGLKLGAVLRVTVKAGMVWGCLVEAYMDCNAQNALQCASHSHTGCYAMCQPAHQEQLEIQCLA